ncbi:MAG: hypothetical protein LBD67_02575, partial [Candidatus Accumulibacter sp.]|nr:hypothetical protein [Accumulibacter sp.]
INHLVQAAAEEIVDLAHGVFGISPRKSPVPGAFLGYPIVRNNNIISLNQCVIDISGPTNYNIMFNNIAWMLRNFPLFGVFGDGRYRIQPIYVDDLAALAIEYGGKSGNAIINAVGPETFTYRELVETIARTIGKPRPIISIPPYLGYLTGRCLGWLTNDVIITRPEIEGLMSGLLCVDTPPTALTRFTEWARTHSGTLGKNTPTNWQDGSTGFRRMRATSRRPCFARQGSRFPEFERRSKQKTICL